MDWLIRKKIIAAGKKYTVKSFPVLGLRALSSQARDVPRWDHRSPACSGKVTDDKERWKDLPLRASQQRVTDRFHEGFVCFSWVHFWLICPFSTSSVTPVFTWLGAQTENLPYLLLGCFFPSLAPLKSMQTCSLSQLREMQNVWPWHRNHFSWARRSRRAGSAQGQGNAAETVWNSHKPPVAPALPSNRCSGKAGKTSVKQEKQKQ